MMNSNAVREAIYDRLDPVIEAIISEGLRDKGDQQQLQNWQHLQQQQQQPAAVPPAVLVDALAPALAAALAPALVPALSAALTPALSAALTAALTPALSAVLSPVPHGNGHQESSSPDAASREQGSSQEGESHN